MPFDLILLQSIYSQQWTQPGKKKVETVLQAINHALHATDVPYHHYTHVRLFSKTLAFSFIFLLLFMWQKIIWPPPHSYSTPSLGQKYPFYYFSCMEISCAMEWHVMRKKKSNIKCELFNFIGGTTKWVEHGVNCTHCVCKKSQVIRVPHSIHRSSGGFHGSSGLYALLVKTTPLKQ